MECLGVEQIIQFLCHPLKDSLNDKDPYVRKTGAQRYGKMMLNYYNLDLSHLFSFGFFLYLKYYLIHLYLDLLFMGFLGVYKSFDFY